MQHKPALGLNRATSVYRNVELAALHVQLLQNFPQVDVQGVVHRQPQGAFIRMLAQIDHCTVETWVLQIRRRHQKLVPQAVWRVF